jgi:hypothetical protein
MQRLGLLSKVLSDNFKQLRIVLSSCFKLVSCWLKNCFKFSNLAILVLIGWSFSLGIGATLLFNLPATASDEVIPQKYQLGVELYVENCGSCHVPIPPGVLPTQSWKFILENPERHYGVALKNLIRLSRNLIWTYLAAYSRPAGQDEVVYNFIGRSRYFKALHPRVELPQPITVQTCIACHPGAKQMKYQPLTSDWDNAP